MSETVNTKALPEILFRLIQTEKVYIKEDNGIIKLMPVTEQIEVISKLRGSLSAYPEMSVDKFLERKHADKELDL